MTEHRSPTSSISAEQQSAPESPDTSPQPSPPHRPQAASQQTRLSLSSMPERPLLQVAELSEVPAERRLGEREEEAVTGEKSGWGVDVKVSAGPQQRSRDISSLL